MGEERDADIDPWTCEAHQPGDCMRSEQLMTNVGQCGQDHIIVQIEGTTSTRCFRPARNTDYHIKIGEVVTTIPTIGFNVESVTYKNLNFNVWVCAPSTLPLYLPSLPNPLSSPYPPYPKTFLSTGSRRPNLHPPLLALLLRQHRSRNLRHRQHRHRPPLDRLGRTRRHAQRRRAARRRLTRFRQ